jgi:hypothetical protein
MVRVTVWARARVRVRVRVRVGSERGCVGTMSGGTQFVSSMYWRTFITSERKHQTQRTDGPHWVRGEEEIRSRK